MCNIEVAIVQICTHVGELYVMSVYRPPSCTSAVWATEMKHLLQLYRDKKVCVIGDMNEDISGNTCQPIHYMFQSSGFTQYVSEPTQDSGTLIDHVYTMNIYDADIKTEVIDCYYSDHDIVACAMLSAT